MAINDDSLDRDPQLARLYQAASGEEPPAALDAAILAAAHRAVHAQPQRAADAVRPPAADTAQPVLRHKRSWYVPVSIAAVLVLSVSLVTLVHQEKGDELAQPPSSTIPQAKVTAPKAESQASRAETSPALSNAPVDVMPRQDESVMPAKRQMQAPRAEAERDMNPMKRHGQFDKTEVTDGRVAPGVKAPEPARRAEVRGVPGTADQPAVAANAAAGAVSAPRQRLEERRLEDFPGEAHKKSAKADEAKAAVDAKEVAREVEVARARVAAEARAAAEAKAELPKMAADAVRTNSAELQVRKADAPPDAPGVALQRQVPQPEASRARPSAPSVAGQVAPAPPPQVPAAAATPVPRSLGAPVTTRPVWLIELDKAPPEKWLERLAQFRREGRYGDAEVLLNEFRRRFPDHPASAR